MAFWNNNKEDKRRNNKPGRGAIVDVPEELKELLDQRAEEFRRIEEKEKMGKAKMDKMADSMFGTLLTVLKHKDLTEDKKNKFFVDYLKKFNQGGDIEQSCTIFSKLFDHKYPVYETLNDTDKSDFDLIINQMYKIFSIDELEVRQLRLSENTVESTYGDDLQILKGLSDVKPNKKFVDWMHNNGRVFDEEFGPVNK